MKKYEGCELLNRQNATGAVRLRQKERTKENNMRTMCATYFLAARVARMAYFNAVQNMSPVPKDRNSGFS